MVVEEQRQKLRTINTIRSSLEEGIIPEGLILSYLQNEITH
jgi:hypothetical protein